ncbi:hypothetical protein [Paracoccus fontiphilus]|uniref:Uncharacterized protein n=1 Tax=Paracoccus fontiphilus TaxID=1815556 RepID=A0ABV7IB26_9RHOB|nr:hypothetical protein [Paracoccus fontiphilus]
MSRYQISETDLPKRMRQFLVDIDNGGAASVQIRQAVRPNISSALRGLIETARCLGLPDRLSQDSGAAFIGRLRRDGWTVGSIRNVENCLRKYAYATGEGMDWAIGSGRFDRRPVELVLQAPHWNKYRHILEEIKANTRPDVIRLADRWMRHRACYLHCDEQVVRAFGMSQSSVMLIARFMAAIDPESPDNIYLQQVQRKRFVEESGKEPAPLSMPYDSVAEPFRSQIEDIARKKQLSHARIKAICSAVRRLCRSCERHRLPLALNMESARAYVDDLFGEGKKPITIAGYCDFLACFAAHAGYDRVLSVELMEVQNATKLEARTALKNKEAKLARSPINLEDLAVLAYRLRRDAPDVDDLRNRRRDQVLSAAIALLAKVQLRVLDLRNAKVGHEFHRDSEGWICDILTSKSGVAIRGRLAAELTPYLDMALLGDVGEEHLWVIYQHRIGTALFGNPARNWQAYSKDWLRRNMATLTGHSPHIVRTLIYDHIAHDPALDVRVGAALCGHGHEASRKAYEVNAPARRRSRATAALEQIAKGLEDYEAA